MIAFLRALWRRLFGPRPQSQWTDLDDFIADEVPPMANAYDPVAAGKAMAQAQMSAEHLKDYANAAAKPRYFVGALINPVTRKWVLLDRRTGRIVREYAHKRGAVAAARRMNQALEPKTPLTVRLPNSYRIADRYRVAQDFGARTWRVWDRQENILVRQYAHKRGAVAAAKRLNLIEQTNQRLRSGT